MDERAGFVIGLGRIVEKKGPVSYFPIEVYMEVDQIRSIGNSTCAYLGKIVIRVVVLVIATVAVVAAAVCSIEN